MRGFIVMGGLDAIEGFIKPKSVAVIGASSDPKKGGYAILANLLEYCGDRLYPVNPKYEEVLGLKCYASVEGLPEEVDLAIVFTPAPQVPRVIEECGRKGIRRVMIQSAGFAEAGIQGRRIQEECLARARKWKIRLWGPNCMGVVNGQERMVASFMRPHVWREVLKPGPVSLIVQSGMASAGFLMQVMSEGYFGLSKACSIGNRCDVNECDILEYLALDESTQVIAMYIESLADPMRFRRVVGGLGKPLLVLLGGLSPDGARAAMSHTASMAGRGELAEALFRQLGVKRAYDFVELMDLTKALALWKGKGLGRNVAIVTFSGAAGIVATDHLWKEGLGLASLSRETREKLKGIFPPWMEPSNPVDIWPAIERNGRKRAYTVALKALVEDPAVDAVHVHMYVDRTLMDESWTLLEPLAPFSGRAAMWLIGDTRCFREVRERVESLGIPVYTEIQRGIRALALRD